MTPCGKRLKFHEDDTPYFDNDDRKCFSFWCSCFNRRNKKDQSSFNHYDDRHFHRNNRPNPVRKCCDATMREIQYNCRQVCVAFYELSTRFLEGKPPFKCEFTITSVAALRLCSVILLVFDFWMMWVPWAEDNRVFMSAIMFIAWAILVLELLTAWFIRPTQYARLMSSDKAYSPKSASYIDNFHLFFELLSLILFALQHAQFFHFKQRDVDQWAFSATRSAIDVTFYDNTIIRGSWAFWRANLYFMIAPLRLFGLVRYWRNRWLNSTFVESDRNSRENVDLIRDVSEVILARAGEETKTANDKKNKIPLHDTKAEKIGTALMVVNSHRTCMLCVLVAALVPPLGNIASSGLNSSVYRETDLLHQFAVVALNGGQNPNCEMLDVTLENWRRTAVAHSEQYGLKFAKVITNQCQDQDDENNPVGGRFEIGEIDFDISKKNKCETLYKSYIISCEFSENVETIVIYDVILSVKWTVLCSLLLQVIMFLIMMLSLQILRNDAAHYVLTSLRGMLRTVLLYAQNPLMVTDSDSSRKMTKIENSDDNLGSETTQLIKAVKKITDLLRKCWGVAGAGIISANLNQSIDGDTVGFNPTVPGKEVYALFGFVAINDFSHILSSLDRDVVSLINEVAKVVHNEVYRWGSNESGQCNKNNGGTFLMVYKIGDFNEVREKEKIAAEMMFQSPRGRTDYNGDANSSRRKSHAWIDKMKSIHLSTLPGISGFTDRALLGMIKSFAGIRKEESLKRWETSFELGAGVGAYSVELIFGMHAGWAVEGAVGSQYKIDATYLSPHVNMSSRMMSACKQYGVFNLLSQSFQELLSKEAKSNLRHIDTVTVKGSEVAQAIYTYDIRHNGVQFFLLKRTEEGSNKEADNYTPEIWARDQDLKAMRGHISPEFMAAFKTGRQLYLSGKWRAAVEKLKEANNIMIHNVVDDGTIDEVALYRNELLDQSNNKEHVCRLRHEIGDGPCAALISFMEKSDCVAPVGWNGVNRLGSK